MLVQSAPKSWREAIFGIRDSARVVRVSRRRMDERRSKRNNNADLGLTWCLEDSDRDAPSAPLSSSLSEQLDWSSFSGLLHSSLFAPRHFPKNTRFLAICATSSSVTPGTLNILTLSLVSPSISLAPSSKPPRLSKGTDSNPRSVFAFANSAKYSPSSL